MWQFFQPADESQRTIPMLELYQFELSQFSEKVRLILDFKGLSYRKIEVVPGVGQLDILRMTGQRQLPVLKDGNNVVADSTAIALYLERTYPDRPILPSDPAQRALCLMLEEWADESIGSKGRKAFLAGFRSSNLRTSILPEKTPPLLKNLVSAIPSEAFDALNFGIGLGTDAIKESQSALQRDMESICTILKQQPYLLGNTPTLADLTVAALSLIVKIPEGNYLKIPSNLKGKGIPGFADNPDYQAFFEWRDRLYSTYRSQNIDPLPPSGSAPTTIAIE
jgi:glutathione S-transferase